MKRTWKFAAGISSLVAAALVAVPALGQPVSNGWTGFYVGAHAGYGWEPAPTKLDAVIFGVPTSWYEALDSTDMPDSHGVRAEGFLGGLQIGRNFQIGSTVYGLEADLSYAAIKGSRAWLGDVTGGSPPTTDPFLLNLARRIEWLTTLRGRVGYAPDSMRLFYLTGGLAAGRIESSALFAGLGIGGTTYFGSQSRTRVGWTAGGGTEFRLTDKLTAKLEYLYFDLGRTTVTSIDVNQANNPFQSRAHFRNTGHFVRVGLNFMTD